MTERKNLVFSGSICIVLALVVMSVAVACAPPSAPAPAPTPTPTPKPQPKLEPINLSFGYTSAAEVSLSKKAHIPWAKMIEEKTKGQVKITHYPSNTLFKVNESWSAIKTGIGDICWVTIGMFPGQFPLTEVVTLPFLGTANGEVGSRILWTLYKTMPEIQAEYAAVKVLFLHTCTPYFIITNKPVRNLEDFKGMKIRTLAGPPTEALKALGGVPVSIPPYDQYVAAEKGVIDGSLNDWGGLESFKLYEVLRYWTDIKCTPAEFMMIMNLDKWNKLPKDVQDAISSVSGDFGSQYYGAEYWDKQSVAFYESLKGTKYECTKVDISPAELAKWREVAGKPVWDKWVADMKAKGLPGQKVLDEALKLIGK